MKRKSKVIRDGLEILSALFLLTACRAEQQEITSNHSSATVASSESGRRIEEEQKAETVLKRSEGWEGKKILASTKWEAKEVVIAEEPVEEVQGEEAAAEDVPIGEPVYIEENVEAAYTGASAEDVVSAEPVVEEPAPVEPVYTYAPTYEEVILPYPTEYIGNPQMDNDQVALRQVGVDGKEIHTWLHAYRDGVWESKHITKTSRFEPVPQIIEVGTNIVVVPEHSSYEQELAKMKELYPGVFE